MKELNVKEILSKMTLEQKANLCSGVDFWHTAAYEELGLPDMAHTDCASKMKRPIILAQMKALRQSVFQPLPLWHVLLIKNCSTQ